MVMRKTHVIGPGRLWPFACSGADPSEIKCNLVLCFQAWRWNQLILTAIGEALPDMSAAAGTPAPARVLTNPAGSECMAPHGRSGRRSSTGHCGATWMASPCSTLGTSAPNANSERLRTQGASTDHSHRLDADGDARWLRYRPRNLSRAGRCCDALTGAHLPAREGKWLQRASTLPAGTDAKQRCES